jgi:hypothetical protein
VLWGEGLWAIRALDGRKQGERRGAIFLLWEKLEQEGPDAFPGKALPSTHTRIRWNGVLEVILEDYESTILLRERRWGSDRNADSETPVHPQIDGDLKGG